MISLNKKIKLFIYINLTILVTLSVVFYYLNKKKIGDESIYEIKSNFLCNSPVYQYYSTDLYLTESSGVKKKIKNKLKKIFIPNISTISIKFIINCRGEIDGVICEAFDKNYLKKEIDEKSMYIIKSEIKSINTFPIVKVNNKNVNAYILLRVKVKDGKVYDIF